MRFASIIPWTCAATCALLGALAVVIVDLDQRVDGLSARPAGDPTRVAALERRVAELAGELDASQSRLRELSRVSVHARELGRGLRELEVGLREAACRLEEQRALSARLELLEVEAGPLVIEERLTGLATSIDQRWREAVDLAARAELAAGAARERVEVVQRELQHDPDRMWHELLGPTVQVSGEETVGTGVLLAADRASGSADEATYVLTAWHVVRDLHVDPGPEAPAIPVSVYAPGGRARAETARLVDHDPALDVALLRLDGGRRHEVRARLASRERLGAVRVFDRVYAVGCPLGNDPIPTFGEVADVNHLVDGQRYWMVSAPTYIGNSGGGIFDAETHELLALFTKIYTHGSVRPMVVPHMGLATPMQAIYDWLDRAGYAALAPVRTEARTASAGY